MLLIWPVAIWRRSVLAFGASAALGRAGERRAVGQHGMSPREFTKAEKKKLRALAREAYARELDNALRDLDSGFSDWRHKYISGFQLAELIHEFHQGPSQDLYSQYERLDPGFLVARALARRLLREDEVPNSLVAALAGVIKYCRESYQDQDE